MEATLNEEKRLQELKEYDVLDTPPENVFDELTALAALSCNTPIALISLSDRKRQWIKSRFGLNISEIPRETSFCKYVIEQRQELAVSDAWMDTRFAENEMVKGSPYIRFYTGVPLISPDGYILGTLCVYDMKPRILTDNQLHSLRLLAKQVVSQLENRSLQIQANKLIALGEMTSHLAHEIQNPLTVLKARLFHLRNKAKQGAITVEEVDSDSHKIEYVVNRMSIIVDGLKKIIQKNQSENFEKVGVTELIEETCSYCQDRMRVANIEFHMDFLPKPVFLRVHGTQISQVLLNLLNNAIDAVQNLSEKRISLEYENLREVFRIKVKDNGPGVHPRIRHKIFLPFFSAKTSERGLGIGLSVSKRLVEANDGRLYFDPDAKETCFVIELKKWKDEMEGDVSKNNQGATGAGCS